MRTTYNQKNISLTIDGISVQDFAEGASCTVIIDGGEVEKTQGTDGASVNIATDQGSTFKFILRETSRSHGFLDSLRKRQYAGGEGVTVVLRTGADVLHSMTNAYISKPGDLSTGDKKQGGQEYTITSGDSDADNLEV